jgi:hypothetical protein
MLMVLAPHRKASGPKVKHDQDGNEVVEIDSTDEAV